MVIRSSKLCISRQWNKNNKTHTTHVWRARSFSFFVSLARFFVVCVHRISMVYQFISVCTGEKRVRFAFFRFVYIRSQNGSLSKRFEISIFVYNSIFRTHCVACPLSWIRSRFRPKCLTDRAMHCFTLSFLIAGIRLDTWRFYSFFPPRLKIWIICSLFLSLSRVPVPVPVLVLSFGITIFQWINVLIGIAHVHVHSALDFYIHLSIHIETYMYIYVCVCIKIAYVCIPH